MRALGEIIGRVGRDAGIVESPIERLMLLAFRRTKEFIIVEGGQHEGAGLFVYPQYEMGPYRLDFLIYAVGFKSNNRTWPPNSEAKIAIECDGREFHTGAEAKERDRLRDVYFKEHGIQTLRFSGSEIYKHGDSIASQIAIFCDERLRGLYE